MPLPHITHKKSGSLLTMFRFCTYKKSGTALLLFRFTGSGIAIVSEQATPKPTPICTHTHPHALFRCTDIDIHIPRTSKCCNVLDTYEFTRFVKPSTKRVMTPLLCLQSRGAAVQYWSILFNIVQSCSILFFHSKFAVQRYNKICNCANFLVESLEFKVWRQGNCLLDAALLFSV